MTTVHSFLKATFILSNLFVVTACKTSARKGSDLLQTEANSNASGISSAVIDVSTEPKLRWKIGEFNNAEISGDVVFKSVINVRGVPCFITDRDVVYCAGSYKVTEYSGPSFDWANISNQDLVADPELTYAVRRDFSASTYSVLYVGDDGKIKATPSTTLVGDLDKHRHLVNINNDSHYDRLGKIEKVSASAVNSLGHSLVCGLSSEGKVSCKGKHSNHLNSDYGTPALGSGGYTEESGSELENVYVEFDKLNQMGPFTQIAAGRDCGCAINSNGLISCWGFPNWHTGVSHVARLGAAEGQYYGNSRYSGHESASILVDEGGNSKLSPSFRGGLAMIPRDEFGPFKGLWVKSHYACTNVKIEGLGYRGYCWGGGNEALQYNGGYSLRQSTTMNGWQPFPQHPDRGLTSKISGGFDFDYFYDGQGEAVTKNFGKTILGYIPETDNGILRSEGEIVDMVSNGEEIAAIDSLGKVHVWGAKMKVKLNQTGHANVQPLFPENMQNYQVKKLAATCIVTTEGKGICAGKLQK
ncbi:MAG: hypothetical protein NT027_00485 [Proteobacteria bacterium]|nr:hypothetical protein [Pseudomonadota bacterium]